MLCQKYIHYTKKINLIVDEYDGEVLDEAKTQRTYFKCYKLQKIDPVLIKLLTEKH